jgi:hypothetical protein
MRTPIRLKLARNILPHPLGIGSLQRTLLLLPVLALVLLARGVTPAAATVGWSVQSVAAPTHFSPNDEAPCNNNSVCDQYQLVIRNVGDETSKGTVTVTDTLPLPPVGAASPPEAEEPEFSQFGAGGWECASEVVGGRPTVTCKSEREVAPEAYAQNQAGVAVFFRIPVLAPSATAGRLKNEVTVTGGGATTAGSTIEETASISTKPPAFEVTDFGFEAINVSGGADTQAGAHPYDVTASFDLADVLRPLGEGQQYKEPVKPVENPRAAVVELPAGFLGDPQAIPTCSEHDLTAAKEGKACPLASRVGVATLDLEGKLYLTGAGEGQSESAIYNIAPEAGYPAEFAFSIAEKMIPVYASVVRASSGYRVRVAAPGIPAAVGPVGVSLTFFGNPAAVDKTGGRPVAFFTNPADCSAGPLTARIEVDSWENPGRWVSKESTTYPQITGCNLLQFNPSIELAPSSSAEGGTTQADEPSGYNGDLKVPQTSLFEERATPELKDATVTLPEGVSVSPAAADGLLGCRETGPEGIDISQGVSGHEAGEGEAIGVDGLPHMTAGHCPAGSTLGTVEVFTPLLPTRCGSEGQAACKAGESPAPLQGQVYLAQPKCGGAGQPACTEASATNGELFGLYLEAEGSGVIVKLPGTVAANPATGQLTGTFKENPQLPFSELKLHFKSGPRAPLANPQSCGTFTTTSDLTPWSAPVTPDATPSSPPFAISGCGSPIPFAPSFTAGTVNPAAGGFSPFTLTFSRHDREQDLSGLSVTLPTGLLGKIAGVPLCEEAQANAGTCGGESQIGTTSVLAGPGEHPLYVPGGRVYLTTGYKGAPFGLSIVVPAVAGPFNLGNVVVRAAIHIDPSTAAVTVVSDPLPQSKDGVPFRLRTVNVEINRAGGFTFNPTNCSAQQIVGTITAAQGASAAVSSPFAVTGCAGLPFKPSFTASTQAKTSKANGASLLVRVAQKPGEANIHKVNLQLPLALPSRLTTLQKACTEAQFNANPAGCPEGSNIGTATAVTPVLSVPLTGPAFLVSHGAAAFPDVEFVLQGQGVQIILDGKTDIKKGITYSRFETVPDAPITSFETILPEGPHSALAATKNLCALTKTVTVRKHKRTVADPLLMPTTITGQNGAVIKQTTKIVVSGCAKKKSLTRKQKLAKALKACRTKSKGKRAGCEKRVRKQYAAVKARTKEKHNKQH